MTATLASTDSSSPISSGGNQAPAHGGMGSDGWLHPVRYRLLAYTRHFRWALILTAFVVCECAVLAANRGQCPLTPLAARFTDDRAANFDIYLPEWLARHNKVIFGTLFVVNELIVLWRWMGHA